MMLKNKVSLLAGALALVGAMYLPQASATVTDLGTLSAEGSIGVSSGWLPKGGFLDWYDFKVGGTASLIASGNSVTFAGGNKGTQITSFDLYEGDHTTLITPGSVSTLPAGNGSFYATLLTYSPLVAGHAYSIEVNGVAKSANGNYSLSLSTAPVPEPEEWAMMLVGAGLVGYQVRRKQKGLNQSSVA